MKKKSNLVMIDKETLFRGVKKHADVYGSVYIWRIRKELGRAQRSATMQMKKGKKKP